MNIAIYVRVSTVEQAKEGYSIGEQTERLTKYAEAHGWHIYKIYTDPGFSGSNMDRPALQELIRAVKQKKFEKVLVYNIRQTIELEKYPYNQWIGNATNMIQKWLNKFLSH